MILYSVVPLEFVFGSVDGTGEAPFIEGEYMGEQVLVSKQEGGGYAISRLLSTDPRSFLNPKLQPGSIVPANELKLKK